MTTTSATGEAGPAINPGEHLGLLFAACFRRARRSGEDPGDLLGDGYVGLLKAARTYDPQRGAWPVHAAVIIGQAIAAAAQRLRPLPQAPAGEDGLEGIVDHRRVPDSDNRLDLDELLRVLPQRERAVLILSFGLDGGGARTNEQVGAAIGVSRQRAAQLKERALQRLRAWARHGAAAAACASDCCA